MSLTYRYQYFQTLSFRLTTFHTQCQQDPRQNMSSYHMIGNIDPNYLVRNNFLFREVRNVMETYQRSLARKK